MEPGHVDGLCSWFDVLVRPAHVLFRVSRYSRTQLAPYMFTCLFTRLLQFCGSEENPADEEVLLTTAPDATGATHWGQQTFFLTPSLECDAGGQQSYQRCATRPVAMPSLIIIPAGFANAGDAIRIVMDITRKKENHRLMRVDVKYKLQGTSSVARQSKEVSRNFHIE